MNPGNRLRALRKAANLTQLELADATGVSQPAISQIENGVLSIDIEWMVAFARVLNCTPADLLADEHNPDRLTAEERAWLDVRRRADQAQLETLERVAAAIVPTLEDSKQAANGI